MTAAFRIFVACAALAGCGGASLGLPNGGSGSGGSGGSGAAGTSGTPVPTRAVDLLFVIDDSSSMETNQAYLLNYFPRAMAVLEALPGGAPSLHVAVVSSDMGAGDGSINACRGNGDAGLFQAAPHSLGSGFPYVPCTDTTLAPGATFIVNDAGQTNYTAANLPQVFNCIAALGVTGCGLESHLGSLARSLGADGPPPPPENQGFLRPDAHLVIVILANEDDCSAILGSASPLYDVEPNSLAAPLGPVASFRCNEFGHVCDQGRPNRHAPSGQASDKVTYTNCRSNETSRYLKSVGVFADQIKRLKVYPDDRILVASIVGLPVDNPNGPIPYDVRWLPAPVSDTGLWPVITPACSGQVGIQWGDPAVRLADFTRRFGANGLLYSICSPDYGPILEDLATQIGQRLAR